MYLNRTFLYITAKDTVRSLRLFVPLIMMIMTVSSFGQSFDAKKAVKSVITVMTFDGDGNLKGSEEGFFISSDGEAVSCYTPFAGASRAVVIDANGKEYDVECVSGANELYDVIKFRTSARKCAFLPTGDADEGDAVWIVRYGTGKNVSTIQGTVERIETFNGQYRYYTLAGGDGVGAPVINASGQCVGIVHAVPTEKDHLTYAVSAPYALSLVMKGLTINDAAMKAVNIRKALPDDEAQAVLTLCFAAMGIDSMQYVGMVDEFITKFPSSAEGYVRRAQLYADGGRYALADADMAQALKTTTEADETHYAYARMVYGRSDDTVASDYGWTAEKAIAEADAAYATNPLPLYKQLVGRILYVSEDYARAYDAYEAALGAESGRTAEMFYEAALCKAALGDTAAMVALTDSAVATFPTPYTVSARPYILAQADNYLSVGRYRDAVLALNEVERLTISNLGTDFYILRADAEVNCRMYAQALEDYDKAITLEPDSYAIYAEKAALQARVGLYEDVIVTARECIRLDADESDGYLFLGLAQCLTGDKVSGVENLNKAKELGNPQAEELINTYGK